MTPEDTRLKQYSVATTIYRFLGGCVLGILLVFIPYSITSIELNPLNLGVASLLVLLCGVLASVLGQRFLAALTRSLESSGFW
jgi:CDP-diglyceride synthetase